MKRFISLLLTTFGVLAYAKAQTRHYFSIDQGFTQTNLTSKMSTNMRTNGFGETKRTDWTFFGLSGTIIDRYPKTEHKQISYSFRYGHHIGKRYSIEAGYGMIYQTIIKGASKAGTDFNYLSIDCSVSNLYTALMVKSTNGKFGAGLGPAFSIFKVKQTTPYQSAPLSNKTQLVPGANLAAYWNFVDQRRWFLGIRANIVITGNATINEVEVPNQTYNNLASTSRSSMAGANMFTLSFSGGFKF